MKTYWQFFQHFYTENSPHLLQGYPGLKFEYCWREFHQYLSAATHHHHRPESFWQQALYLPKTGGSDPVDLFCQQLLQWVPLQYISQCAFFYRSSFYVNPHVLIPRSETEILVEMAVEWSKQLYADSAKRNLADLAMTAPLRVADVGTGSGCIILSLLQELSFPVEAWACDLSLEALNVAKRNAFLLRSTYSPQSTLKFLQGDRLLAMPPAQQFDLILSNPPYIKRKQHAHLVHEQVLNYEPHSSLFLPDEEYSQWFMQFFQQIVRHLGPGGIFLMEGHEEELESLRQLSDEVTSTKAVVVLDYSQRKRFLHFRV